MNQQAQRIAIAEACGTHRVEWEIQDPKFASPCTGTMLTDKHGRRKFISDSEAPRREWQHLEFTPIADYLGDLNAITAAARYLKDNLMSAEQWEDFGRWLQRLRPTADLLPADYSQDPSPDFYDFATLMTDTPAARYCEALLRAANLYTDD